MKSLWLSILLISCEKSLIVTDGQNSGISKQFSLNMIVCVCVCERERERIIGFQ